MFYIISMMDGLVAGASVLAARGAVVVGAVARSVVVVVLGAKEVNLAPIPVPDERVTCCWAAAERHCDGIARGVAASHRLAPVAVSHDELLPESGEDVIFAVWHASRRELSLTMKADIYINIGLKSQ